MKVTKNGVLFQMKAICKNEGKKSLKLDYSKSSMHPITCGITNKIGVKNMELISSQTGGMRGWNNFYLI